MPYSHATLERRLELSRQLTSAYTRSGDFVDLQFSGPGRTLHIPFPDPLAPLPSTGAVIPADAGAQIRDGIKSVAKQGACKEATWPYQPVEADPQTHLFPPNSPPATKPPAAAYHEAEVYRAKSYFRVQQSLSQIKGCLAEGFPAIIGFSVYDSMYDANGNPVTVLPMPSGGDNLLGGHAVLIVGYDDSKHLFTIRNSWGPDVQDHGYFYMPYSYAADPNLASDFWTIRGMTA